MKPPPHRPDTGLTPASRGGLCPLGGLCGVDKPSDKSSDMYKFTQELTQESPFSVKKYS